MLVRTLKTRDLPSMPWKDGGGTTTELAIHPPGSRFADGTFLWRVSAARVSSDCTFSSFPGYDRLLAIREGAGLRLDDKPLPPGEILAFAGENRSRCELFEGPVGDLGVIFRRNAVRAGMELIQLASAREVGFPSGCEWAFVVAMRGTLEVEEKKGTHTVLSGDFLRIDGPAPGETLRLRARDVDTKVAFITLAATV
jgi:environmental stress-induced protein Ves